MNKRTIAILITLVVLAFGVSAYALAPTLLAEGTNQETETDGIVGTTSLRPDTAQEASMRNSDRLLKPTADEGDAAGGTSGTTAADGSVQGSNPDASPGSTPSSTPSGATGGTEAAPAPAYQPTVTISVDAMTYGWGYIMAPRTVAFSPGETVFDVLGRECRASGIHMEHNFNPMYNSAYVKGISNLYEFDGGPESGWMYSVNGWFPNYGSSAYVLSDGDVICWRYTCNLGNDIGGGYAVGMQ